MPLGRLKILKFLERLKLLFQIEAVTPIVDYRSVLL